LGLCGKFSNKCNSITRNSAIADKLHDAFVHYAMEWLTVITPLPMCVTTPNLVILHRRM